MAQIGTLTMSEKSKKTEKNKAPSKNGTKLVILMIIAGALVPFGAPTLLVCLGLIPTLVALFTDTDPNKSGVITVGFLNLAGVMPFLIDLWTKGHSIETALRIMRDPMTWVIMLGAAAIGQLILYAVPTAMTVMAVNRMEARLHVLREGLEQLKAIWGTDVATNRPVDLVRRSDDEE